MAQNISLWNSVYSDVPAIVLPKQGGGTATFTDVTDTTASASDVATGKYFYTSAGVRTQGTNSGGGSGDIQVGEEWADELSVAGSTLTFSNLLGEPTSFYIMVDDDLSTGAQPWKIASVVYDGVSFHGQIVTNTSNANASYLSSGFSMAYSNNTLTITSTDAYFQPTAYLIWYTYGGSSANISTQDVQVGSGATSITFTGLTDEPTYFSCIFKSNFGTSSGYQRVMSVGHGFGTSGVAMDSSAHSMGAWSYTYNNGSLTITSNGTNQGGYFHQPGYYQLTYVIDASGNYQTKTKTYTPTTSQQTETIMADNGYDALKRVDVTVNAMPTMTLPSATSATSSGTSKATITPSSSAQYLNIPTGYNETAQYYTISASGGGSVQYDTKTATASNYPTSLQFTSMKGEPKFFAVRLNASVSSSGSTTYYYIVDIISNGTTTHGNCFRIGSTRQVNSITSGYSWSYSGTTLTITSSAASRSASPGAFYSGSYELMYAY